ncbi:mitochondrial chaperone BCS1 [Microdochium trichocladiopsis]|uniref:Mitochondrial chaperone BCS1 n=1 Tax=Microdochium trichocladiopsis TaxID=1682393 RepID=A0A9P8XYN1_9PEZI|nr:mitochondrial chaperone BCS1 [Microdochium trichocladiopsis]KAH7025202.1 mitochondrial chaperone BCS1 [Microdochium trichocladiopsis]
MKTVILESALKELTLKDMNNYLHPKTPGWYAKRGIPLRRGYLFSGLPGTGKTSFCLALAGVFGLTIHILSLNDASLTEEDLNMLFSKLPPRCIVLLEDIDTAGLSRSGNKSDSPSVEGGLYKSRKQGISLSGLLNAIDGVASQEGRVLIMTTNAPEKLDQALVRPGRVDLHIKFNKATCAQAQEQFVIMFQRDEKGPMSRASPGAQGNQHRHDFPDNTVNEDQLRIAAKEFGSKIPEGQLSPAQIQGFLIQHRDDPMRAVREVADWVEETRNGSLQLL